MADLKKLIKEESYKMLDRKQRKSLKENKLNRIIKEELAVMLKEAKDNGPNIHEKLEKLREELVKEEHLSMQGRGGTSTQTGPARAERRLPVATAAKMIDVPLSELVLHLLNSHRIKEQSPCLVEYRLGMVCFYGNPETQEVE